MFYFMLGCVLLYMVDHLFYYGYERVYICMHVCVRESALVCV
uniref:Uncharacterized protein n=1 Tax=Anguilla anguilla TaxID=7936 RepID=A0A0E9VC13_ANGAN